MPNLPLHKEQLEFMIRLANSRIEFLDPLFRFLNYLDSIYFFLVLIPVLWLGLSYRWGIRIFYWFTFNNLILSFAKNWFQWPRPSMDIPELGMFHPQTNGFPSGGAMTCMFLGILLIYYWKTRSAWVIGLLYILLVSFSRLYLGVHYPIDILGGWILASIIAALFIYLNPLIERFLILKGPYFSLLLSLAIPIVFMLVAPQPNVYFVMGSTIGIGIGIHVSLKYNLFLPDAKNVQEGFSRAFIGVTTLFLIYFLLANGRDFTTSFAVGLFMSIFASPICRLFRAKT